MTPFLEPRMEARDADGGCRIENRRSPMRRFALFGLPGLLVLAGCFHDCGWQHFVPRPSWGPHSTGPIIHPDCPHCKPECVGRVHAHACGEMNMTPAADICHMCGRPKSAPKGNCSCDCHTGH